MEKHTLGPWTIAYNDPFTVLHQTGNLDYRFVAYTDSRHDTGRQDDSRVGEDCANACLIAAAPDLLAVAQKISALWDRLDMVQDRERHLVEPLRAAIATAEGR